jgi:hypothetical protein
MKIHQLPVGQQLSIHGANAEEAGNFDTLFKFPVFVEDTERSAIYTFCPAEVEIQYAKILESELQSNDRKVASCQMCQ